MPNRVDIYTPFPSNARVSGGIFAWSPLRAFMANLGTIGVDVWLEVCLSLVFFVVVAVINAMTISNLGRRVLISAFGWSPTRIKVRAGILESEIEDWKQRPRRNTADWLDPYGSFSLLYYTIQDPLARAATSPSSLGLPTPIVDQENVLQTFPWANLMEAIFSIEVPCSRITPVKLTKTNQLSRFTYFLL